jgi:tetratricopeptide (TPR) repeat protein
MSAIMTEPAPGLGDSEGKHPPQLERVLERALKKEPDERYGSVAEISEELTQLKNSLVPTKKSRSAVWIGLAMVVAAVIVVAGLRLLPHRSEPVAAASPDPVSVLIADFDNLTGDEVFDGALEQALAIGLEEATFVSSFGRNRAARVAQQIQGEGAGLDVETSRLVAQREAVNIVMGGSIAPADTGYRITVTALDSHTGDVIVSNEAAVSGKDRVLPAMADLTVETRRALGDTTPDSVLLAAKETFTAASLEAAAAYSRAQTMMGEGRWADAIEEYRQAVQLDPAMGRAYAGAAVCFANMGRLEEAEQQFQQAVVHIDKMTNREKYRSRGAYYLMTRNYAKAADEYTALVSEYPYDAAGINNLPLAHLYGRNMALAVQEGRRAVETYPDHLMLQANLALYSMYAGLFEDASREAARVLEVNPSYELAFVAQALSALGAGDVETAIERYQTLRSVSAWGASLAASGLADVALYQGRLTNAVAILEQGVRGDRAAENEGEAARKLATLAGALADLGRVDEAVAAADEAVASSRRPNVLVPAAFVYIELDSLEKANELADELGARVGPDPRVYSSLISARAALAAGRTQEAILLAAEAQKTLDTWLGRFLLGRSYLEADAFAEAHSEFERCLERRGEATALFLDDVPTYRYLPPVHYWLGRALEGLGSDAAAESYLTYLEIKANGDGGTLVEDARRRLSEQ